MGTSFKGKSPVSQKKWCASDRTLAFEFKALSFYACNKCIGPSRVELIAQYVCSTAAEMEVLFEGLVFWCSSTEIKHEVCKLAD